MIAAGLSVAAVVGELLPPGADVDQVRENLKAFLELADGALSWNTLRALRSDGRVFARWCREENRSWLPAEPATVVEFIRAVGASRKPATVTRYLATIATWHGAAGLVSPTLALPVKLARRAHARAKGVAQKQAAPIGRREIARIFRAMSEEQPVAGTAEAARHLRDRALLLVASDTLARVSELGVLRWDDLASAEDGSGTILIRRGKGDQEGAGRVGYLAVATMAALVAWRAEISGVLDRAKAACEAEIAHWEAASRRFYRSRRRTESIERHLQRSRRRLESIARSSAGEFVFWQLGTRPRNGVGAGGIARIFKRRGALIDGRTMIFSGHSTRVGTTQDLIEDGADIPGAMHAGGWKTPTMVARYADRLLAQRGAVARMRRNLRTDTGA